MELNKITREEFFDLDEDKILFITHPGRMGDEDGSTFIIKDNDKYTCYRIGGWYMGNKDGKIKEYISYSEMRDFLKEWDKTVEHWDKNQKDDKYQFIYMGFGNILFVDKRIYDEYEPFLLEEANKIKERDKETEIKPYMYFNSWDKAFLNMIKK